MTPVEVVKALLCCRLEAPCDLCPAISKANCMDVVTDAAADLIERLEKEKAERWVPATEPPKEWKDEKTGYMINYLINCVYSGVDVGSYHAEAGCWLCCGLPVTVTHWMPLPEAPEVE